MENLTIEDKELVVKLFMDESDLRALNLLYKLTKDPLVKILINWYKDYEIIEDAGETNEYYMYDDIIQYIFKKYKLEEV